MADAFGLTKKQADALRFIGEFFARHGYAPTIAEVCVGVGMSPKSESVMFYRIQRLRERGYLRARLSARQTIILTDDGKAYCKLHRLQYSRGSASDPSKPSAPARPLETARIHMGQEARAGIHFRRLEAES